MPLRPRLISLWRNLIHKNQRELELAEEIQAYLEMLVEAKLKEGLDPAEARRAALIEPALGRTFLPEEDQPGHNRVAILSHSLWQRRFGADPAIIGQKTTLSGNIYTVVGVMPPGFHYPQGAEMPLQDQFAAQSDMWVPAAFTSEEVNLRFNWNYAVIARLRSGVTIGQAQTQLSTIAAQNSKKYPETDGNFRVVIIPMQEQIGGGLKPALLLLLGAAGLVLLIAWANVASLWLVRTATRQKEITIRTALGASPQRIIRQLLTESVWLSMRRVCSLT